ncbi:MAG: hypothetical protein A2427_03445 [Candidatus Nealsonbacteria bacterium RIFOXYC1_FULL_40_7]|uniref:DUF2207 domain-containing protein n=1 Tax=Candidatus Nealsonbacteria bacterium RIFOXYC1_FULL_40_7 TaxID=1801678 RepID=A0A1G2ENJ4_9BACT|nr:MAG: hypothetical protein A2427_03445 [Candidatus Nealsonbacteria bacterium RIFOXYC1_FULL_40_7]
MNLKLILFFLILFSPFCSKAAYYYDSIDVKITVNKDSTFDVEERQTYFLDGSFGYFFRDIDLNRLDHLSEISAFDEKGNRIDNISVSGKGDKIHIQWDFERRNFKKELKSWTIKYKVHGGLGFYKDYDELYWNAVFGDRDVLVAKSEVKVFLPKDIPSFKVKLFVGPAGSVKQFETYSVFENSAVFSGNEIKPRESMTIVIWWPKGFIEKPFLYQNQMINLSALALGILIPLVVFIISYSVWRKKGRDAKIEKTIISQYDSPLSPALSAVVARQNITAKDVLAIIVDLAVRGYLKIKEEEKGFSIFKHKEYSFERMERKDGLLPFEEKILDSLFGGSPVVLATEIRRRFHIELPAIKKEIFKEVEKTSYFNGNIEKTRKKYGFFYSKVFVLLVIIIFAFVFFSGFLKIPADYFPIAIIAVISIAISSFIGMAFAYYMPVLTKEGAEAKWHILGFKEYLNTAERFRIGEETADTFSKLLPFAIVFGVEKQWAKRFSYLKYTNQNWFVPAQVYSGQGGSPSSFSEFASSISNFSNSVSSAFGSSSGGSGASGGSAGGGGGGGGGGAG